MSSDRDLKPANIMLDRSGQVRITDFGLAVLASEVEGPEARAGTPAYMSPEQLEGQTVTVKSDLYSLGLVLYELFTGSSPFAPRADAETSEDSRTRTPRPPSSHVEMNPSTEEAIMQCLQPAAADRPSSAWDVASRLPGGDPLAAAIQAGDTPGPGLVADARSAPLRPRVAVLCLVSAVIGQLLFLGFRREIDLVARTPLPKEPAVLAADARDILSTAGVPNGPTHAARGFALDMPNLIWVESHRELGPWWDAYENGMPSAIHFWYREARQPMVPWRRHRVDVDNPPLTETGMSLVRLDPEGRLLELKTVGRPDTFESREPFDWRSLFEAAGLDLDKFQLDAPSRNRSGRLEVRRAWVGLHPRLGEEVRVEASARDVLAMFFRVVFPWEQADRETENQPTDPGYCAVWILLLASLVALIVLAIRNLRARRGDRRSALQASGVLMTL